VAFDPDELDSRPAFLCASIFASAVLGTDLFSLLEESKDLLDEVFVLDCLLGGSHPAILAPVLEPYSDAVDSVGRVGVDRDRSIAGRQLECAQDRGQLGSLIRLTSP